MDPPQLALPPSDFWLQPPSAAPGIGGRLPRLEAVNALKAKIDDPVIRSWADTLKPKSSGCHPLNFI